ncbi:hypothetical protein Syun_007115 [Stephania yunnanensis]|uniref:Uncharacterized protein n=1 Tax=Stephania yunnanensis TaxID=152371 RepID=A0AAP0KZN5_9MAGN
MAAVRLQAGLMLVPIMRIVARCTKNTMNPIGKGAKSYTTQQFNQSIPYHTQPIKSNNIYVHEGSMTRMIFYLVSDDSSSSSSSSLFQLIRLCREKAKLKIKQKRKSDQLHPCRRGAVDWGLGLRSDSEPTMWRPQTTQLNGLR